MSIISLASWRLLPLVFEQIVFDELPVGCQRLEDAFRRRVGVGNGAHKDRVFQEDRCPGPGRPADVVLCAVSEFSTREAVCPAVCPAFAPYRMRRFHNAGSVA